MPKLRTYIAQFRVAFDSESDVHAEETAEHLQARMAEHLDEDDTVRVTEVVCMGEPETREESITRLRLARNELVRLPFRDTMNLAQQVDQVIWMLINKAHDDDPLTIDGYDFNRIIRVAESIKHGENPLY